MDQGSSVDYALYVWRPGDTSLTRLMEEPHHVVSAGGGLAVVDSRLLTVPCTTCPVDRPLLRAIPGSGPVGPLAFGPVVEPRTRTAAALAGNRIPTRVTLFTDSGRREVPGSRGTFDILAFLGPDRLLVRQDTARSDPFGPSLRVLDLEGGGSTPRVALDEVLNGSATQGAVATGLADRPTFESVEPPRPLDPRLVAGGVVLAVLSGAAYLVLWRRRARI